MSIMRGYALILALIGVITAQANATQYPENPLRVGASIYVSHQGVYRFDSSSAEPVWSTLADVETFAPVVAGDLLLVGSTQGLYALQLADGAIAWHSEKQHTLFTPSIAGQAYAGSVHGELYALALSNGAITWRKSFDGWVYSPAISDDSKSLWTGGQAHEVMPLPVTMVVCCKKSPPRRNRKSPKKNRKSPPRKRKSPRKSPRRRRRARS